MSKEILGGPGKISVAPAQLTGHQPLTQGLAGSRLAWLPWAGLFLVLFAFKLISWIWLDLHRFWFGLGWNLIDLAFLSFLTFLSLVTFAFLQLFNHIPHLD